MPCPSESVSHVPPNSQERVCGCTLIKPTRTHIFVAGLYRVKPLYSGHFGWPNGLVLIVISLEYFWWHFLQERGCICLCPILCQHRWHPAEIPQSLLTLQIYTQTIGIWWHWELLMDSTAIAFCSLGTQLQFMFYVAATPHFMNWNLPLPALTAPCTYLLSLSPEPLALALVLLNPFLLSCPFHSSPFLSCLLSFWYKCCSIITIDSSSQLLSDYTENRPIIVH